MRLIDADELKSVFTKKSTEAVCGAELCKAIISRIDDALTIDAAPVRHGVWKKIRGTINCSACKSCSWSMSFEDLVTSFNFCPNCGAKMDGEEKEKTFWPRYLLKPCTTEEEKQNE